MHVYMLHYVETMKWIVRASVQYRAASQPFPDWLRRVFFKSDHILDKIPSMRNHMDSWPLLAALLAVLSADLNKLASKGIQGTYLNKPRTLSDQAENEQKDCTIFT